MRLAGRGQVAGWMLPECLGIPAMLLAPGIHALQNFSQPPFCLQLQVYLHKSLLSARSLLDSLKSSQGLEQPCRPVARTYSVKVERCASILNRVMGDLLDVMPEQVGRQESQAELALLLEVEQVYCVYHLRIGQAQVASSSTASTAVTPPMALLRGERRASETLSSQREGGALPGRTAPPH